MNATALAFDTTIPDEPWFGRDALAPSRGVSNTIAPIRGRVVAIPPDQAPQTASTIDIIELDNATQAPTDLGYTSTSSHSTQFEALSVELFSYLRLPEGWDGYDGIPASLSAISDAFSFVSSRPEDIPLPAAQLSSDGEVGLYWRTHDFYGEVGFYGDGLFSYYALFTPADGNPVEHGDDDCVLVDDYFVTREWPEDLVLALGKICP